MSISFPNFYQELARRNVEITVTLKNELSVSGTLIFTDQNLNFFLEDIRCSIGCFANTSTCFVRGSSVKHVSIPSAALPPLALQDLLLTLNVLH